MTDRRRWKQGRGSMHLCKSSEAQNHTHAETVPIGPCKAGVLALRHAERVLRCLMRQCLIIQTVNALWLRNAQRVQVGRADVRQQTHDSMRKHDHVFDLLWRRKERRPSYSLTGHAWTLMTSAGSGLLPRSTRVLACTSHSTIRGCIHASGDVV